MFLLAFPLPSLAPLLYLAAPRFNPSTSIVLEQQEREAMAAAAAAAAAKTPEMTFGLRTPLEVTSRRAQTDKRMGNLFVSSRSVFLSLSSSSSSAELSTSELPKIEDDKYYVATFISSRVTPPATFPVVQDHASNPSCTSGFCSREVQSLPGLIRQWVVLSPELCFEEAQEAEITLDTLITAP